MKRYFPTLLLCVALLFLIPGCSDDQPDARVDAGLDAGADASSDDAGRVDAADAKSEVGERCFGPQDCVEGASCIGTGEADTYHCMQDCSERWRICDDGSVCTPRLSSESPICFSAGATPRGERCESNLECEPGTLCFGADGERYCLDACHQSDPEVCGERSRCEVIDSGGKGLCRSELGAACSTAAECADQMACTEELGAELDELLPDGYCTEADCTTDADCPFDGACRTLPGADTPICLAGCESDGDCRFGQDYRCLTTRYCDQTDDPAACESLRADRDVCAPTALVSNL